MPLWMCSWPARAENSSMRAFTSWRVTRSRASMRVEVDLVDHRLVVLDDAVGHVDAELALGPQHGHPQPPLEHDLVLGRPQLDHRRPGVAQRRARWGCEPSICAQGLSRRALTRREEWRTDAIGTRSRPLRRLSAPLGYEYLPRAASSTRTAPAAAVLRAVRLVTPACGPTAGHTPGQRQGDQEGSGPEVSGRRAAWPASGRDGHRHDRRDAWPRGRRGRASSADACRRPRSASAWTSARSQRRSAARPALRRAVPARSPSDLALIDPPTPG